jgi:enamine deaminase RidA (YjgF/YER057c/UK114 family)
VLAVRLEAMSTTPRVTLLPETGPYDDRGRLVHEDDAAAQVALSLVGLEAAVAEAGHTVADVGRILVRTVDVRVLDDVVDVLTERLEQLGTHPEIEVVSVTDLGVPGVLVTLQATLTTTRRNAQ